MKSTKHLDLGCGSIPRNPYQSSELYAVDIYKSDELPNNVIFAKANLYTEPIPFDSNSFSSVSAYDFLEHVPRVLSDEKKGTRLPFIELMNEVWRVLEPNGTFFAIMPVYPHKDLFKDPTHVNFITADTHEYFAGPTYAKMYGFNGKFDVLRVEKVFPRIEKRKDSVTAKKIKSFFRQFLRFKQKSHIVWELKAIK